jgi:hypothetical protein
VHREALGVGSRVSGIVGGGTGGKLMKIFGQLFDPKQEDEEVEYELCPIHDQIVDLCPRDCPSRKLDELLGSW